MPAEKGILHPLFYHFFGKIQIFKRGGTNFSIFQSKFKGLKPSIFECFSRFGIFCRSRNFCIGYTKAKFFNVCLQNQYYIQSIDSGMLKTWNEVSTSEKSRNHHVFTFCFSGKNYVVWRCKNHLYQSVQVRSPQFFWLCWKQSVQLIDCT